MNRVRWTQYKGRMDAMELDRIHIHPLYQIGDTILVWVNEGDILAFGHNVAEKLVEKPPELRGCICPPGAEATCQCLASPRRHSLKRLRDLEGSGDGGNALPGSRP